MRQLIDVQFQDNTSYPSQIGNDVGAIVMDCLWGPVNKVVKCDFPTFLSNFPLMSKAALSHSYLTAYRAFQSGLTSIEVVRRQGPAKYVNVVWGATTLSTTAAPTLVDDPFASAETKGFALKHPGLFKEMTDPLNSDFKITIEAVASEAGLDEADIKVSLSYVNSDGDTVILEEVQGSSVIGTTLDGQDYYLGTKLSASKYFVPVNPELQPYTDLAVEAAVELDFPAVTVPAAQDAADLVADYLVYFSDIENSVASILIDPGTTLAAEANSLISVAAARSDLVALIGLPTTTLWEASSTPPYSAITDYKASLTPSMFASFYAAQEIFTIEGRTYVLNGIGTIAGRYAAVASQDSVNQLPSAKTWGTFPGALSKTVSFAQVLAFHALGINSVYSTSQGPRIFGLRSLHARSSSYYSKFNVARVCARILKYGFGVAMDVIHTGNTPARKSLTQNLLNADLNRLKAVGALRVESSVLCSEQNNQDIDTNGGEILIIDYTCYFVKLIEKVNIRITATDSSVTASVS